MRALNDFERRRHGAAEPHTQAALSGRGSEDCAVGAAGSGGATGAQGLRAAAEREQANRRECGCPECIRQLQIGYIFQQPALGGASPPLVMGVQWVFKTGVIIDRQLATVH